MKKITFTKTLLKYCETCIYIQNNLIFWLFSRFLEYCENDSRKSYPPDLCLGRKIKDIFCTFIELHNILHILNMEKYSSDMKICLIV